MARLISREFHPAVPVYVRRFFVAAGRHWDPGDMFDWQRLAVAQRRVKQLFDAGKLMHEAPMPESDWAGLQARESASSAPSVQTEAEDETILAAASEGTAGDDLAESLREAAGVEPTDELDELDMKALREIAAAEDAPTRVSREAQREAIRENRKAKARA